MSQPTWQFVRNLGDKSPLDYGGYFIFIDTTGVYAPEAEVLEVDEELLGAVEEAAWAHEGEEGYVDDRKPYTVYRFALDPCTYDEATGVLSDNKFHPELAAWFAHPESRKAERPQDSTYLSNVAESCGQTVEELVRLFCSADPVERAEAYRAVWQYHRLENFDHDPLQLTVAEAKARYAGLKDKF